MARTSELIRGLGTAVRLITLLIDEVKKRGGTESMIVALTKDDRRPNLEAVAEMIVSLPWRDPIPKSRMIQMVRDWSKNDGNDELGTVDDDAELYWEPMLQRLDIPYIRFNSPPEEWEGAIWPVPPELAEQLEGKKTGAGICVTWQGKEYVVVGFGLHNREIRVGETIEVEKLRFLHLTRAHYFDLNN